MRKYECNACGIRICTAEYQDGSGVPFKCTDIVDGYRKPQWKEIVELPKLTAEVFDRLDCPQWAKYAAISSGGWLTFYEDKPRMSKDEYPKRWINYDRWYPVEGTKFDVSDWQNSLIERPKKNTLPDWCKKGKLVWDKRNGYGEIKSVRDDRSSCYIEFDGGAGDFVPEAFSELKPARRRPYNDEEMKGLVGKVVCDTDGNNELITGWSVDMKKVRFCSIYYSAQRFLDGNFTIDGSPCGVLEHFEAGEWVR